MWTVLSLAWGLKGIGAEAGVALREGSDWTVGGRVGSADGRRGRA